MPIPSATAASDQKDTPNFEDEISREIVEAEQSSAWTLMHRYNKAHDLLEKVVQVAPFPLPLDVSGSSIASPGLYKQHHGAMQQP